MVHEFDGRTIEVDSLGEVTVDRLRTGTVVLRADAAPSPTEWGWGLSSSLLSFRKDADAVYRGLYRGEDVQVRAYPDRYTVQLDHANPVEAPIRHLLLDVPPRLRALLLGGIGVGLLAVVAVGVGLL